MFPTIGKQFWQFSYTVAQVLAGAQVKLEWHKGREAHWSKTKEEVIVKIKDEGLEIDESLAGSGSNVNYGRRTEINVRNDLMRDLHESDGKVKEHAAKVQEYGGWVQVLEAQKPADTLQLTQADWLYFFHSFGK